METATGRPSSQGAQRAVAGRPVDVDVTGLVVVEERDRARLAAIHVGDMSHQPGPEEFLDPVRNCAIGMPADARPIGVRLGDGVVVAGCLVVHGASLERGGESHRALARGRG